MRRWASLASCLMHLLTSLALSIAGLVLLPFTSQAQTPTIDQGTNPYSVLHGGDIDSVSLANGNLLLHIPLISYPQRGDLHLGFFIAYDNHSLQKTVVSAGGHNDTYYSIKGFGVHIQEDLPWGNSVIEAEQNYYEAMTPDGASHPLASTSDGLISMDATGFNYNVSSTILIDRDGTRITGGLGGFGSPSRIEDRNGNLITFGTTNITDSVNRTIPIPPGSSGASTAPCPNPSTLPGALTPSAASLWNLPGPSGSGGSPMTICYAEVPITYDPCGGQLYCYGANGELFPLIQSIVLPNGTSWTFLYDSYGDVAKIAFPMGGAISYTWATKTSCITDPTSCPVAVATRSVTDNTGTHMWTYSGNTAPIVNHTEVVTIMDPDQNQTIHTFSDLGVGGANPALYETSAEYYQNISGTQTPLKTVTTAFSSSLGSFAGTAIAFNVVPTSVTTTWPNNQVSEVTKTYDSGVGGYLLGQLIQEQDYDYGTGSKGSLLRTTINSYLAPGNSSYLANNLLDLRSSVQVNNGAGTKVAYTTYGYDSGTLASSGITTQRDTSPPDGTLRGNQTSVAAWLNTTGGYLTTSKTFFDTGEVNIVTDPNLNKTTYAYSSTYVGSLPTSITNALNQITTKGYDLNTGLLTSTKDPNSQTTSFTYDNMWRVASITYPDGGSATITHQETSFPFTAKLTKAIASAENYVMTNTFDGLGRVVESLVTDPQGNIETDTTYDHEGRKYTVSNPYRNTTDSTYGITTYQYDALNRPTLVIPPDGSSTSDNVSTQYCGGTTLVTDQAAHWRRSKTDGLGRLIEVDEPNSTTATVNVCPGTGEPIWVTTYGYDALSDLTSVVQGGSRNRNFVFDSLKHLTSSTNPEAGTVTYTYDGDSNVLTKKDARSITITYGYDALNRMTGKTYSNGDPAVSYSYDQSGCLGLSACYNVGRRTAMTDAGGSESWAYDKMGREWAEQRTTNSINKSTAYTYNLDGSLATLTYPSGRIITYTTDPVQRPSEAQDVANGINYAMGTCSDGTDADGVCYAPQGATSQMQNGANLISTLYYDKRLQSCRVSVKSSGTAPASCTDTSNIGNVLDFTYNFGIGVADNGNVMGIANNIDNTRTQTFTYDQVNRIVTAQTPTSCGSNCWSQSFTYDQWANLTAAAATGSAPSLSLSVNANNQITTTGFNFDAASNETSDVTSTYGWNAESQIKTAAGVNYTYDGDGGRVQKSNGKIYWYGAGSEILDESDASGNITDEYIFFGGRRIARRDSSGNVIYYVADHLGTSRVVTNSAGVILDQSDFYPFGGEHVFTSSSGNTYKFEGKERDVETNNDDFGARYYSSVYGRFLTADWSEIPAPVPYANLTNPQTLNLYAIVSDNPETFADLDGHMAFFGEYWDNSAGPKPTENPSPTTTEQTPAGQSQTLNVGGVNVDVSFSAAEFSGGAKGAVIDANPQGACDNCRWAQTVTRTGDPTEPTHTDREAMSGAQPLYPGGQHEGNNGANLNDKPKSSNPGTFTAVSTLGVADKANKTFKATGSITWGYKIDKNGKVSGAAPRVATPAEQARSIAVLRRESPTWTISH